MSRSEEQARQWSPARGGSQMRLPRGGNGDDDAECGWTEAMAMEPHCGIAPTYSPAKTPSSGCERQLPRCSTRGFPGRSGKIPGSAMRRAGPWNRGAYVGEHFQPATGGQGMTAVCLVGPAIIWDCCPCGSISDLLEHCKAGNAYGKPSLHPNIDTEYGEHRAKSTK